MAVAQELSDADGRRLRREQNREAVIDAMLSLFRDGIYQPSTAQVAARAGLSLRSLFRYFDDVNDLHRAAVDRQLSVAVRLVDPHVGPDEPTATKIAAVVRARAELFEVIGPASRALRAGANRRPMLAGQLGRNRAFLRQQLSEVFAPELVASAALLPGLEVLCSFEAYELLRHDQGLSRTRAEAALRAAMSALLRADEQPR
ncbi:MAG TPA: TetR/AcrR family transcriptional regulator [Streptosporangiaceae bacterium]|nr:TetR/AcrR family transcriptional regulator [Streptosporangiaceae bacterium]